MEHRDGVRAKVGVRNLTDVEEYGQVVAIKLRKPGIARSFEGLNSIHDAAVELCQPRVWY